MSTITRHYRLPLTATTSAVLDKITFGDSNADIADHIALWQANNPSQPLPFVSGIPMEAIYNLTLPLTVSGEIRWDAFFDGITFDPNSTYVVGNYGSTHTNSLFYFDYLSNPDTEFFYTVDGIAGSIKRKTLTP